MLHFLLFETLLHDLSLFSNPGHPFCSGVTLSKLAAVTIDEDENETFDTSVALDRLHKVRISLIYLTF